MKLSIIVPVYNVEEYLPRCLDSILAQTFTDFELILVDDGSPDRCGEIIEEYAKMDSRIVSIHKENGGVSSARNSGVNVAQGEYIAFVDPDDWIEPLMFEMLLNSMKMEQEISICACGIFFHDTIHKKERIVNVSHLGKSTITSCELMKVIATSQDKDMDIVLQSVWNKVFRSTVFDGLSFFGNFGEDCAIITEIFSHDYKVKIDNNPLYHYNIHNSSLTQKKHIEESARFLEIYRRRAELYKDETIIESSEYSYCQSYIYYYCEFRKNRIDWPYDRSVLVKFFEDLRKNNKCTLKMSMLTSLFLLSPNVYYRYYLLRH